MNGTLEQITNLFPKDAATVQALIQPWTTG